MIGTPVQPTFTSNFFQQKRGWCGRRSALRLASAAPSRAAAPPDPLMLLPRRTVLRRAPAAGEVAVRQTASQRASSLSWVR